MTRSGTAAIRASMTTLTFAGWASALVLAGCARGAPTEANGDGAGPDAGTGSAGADAFVDVQPTYPTQHPRIYLGANAARLKAALTAGRPAAVHFKTLVDNELAGADYYNFSAWNAALLGQLTGDPTYCAQAISVIEPQVTTAEAAIAAGSEPDVAGDSYLHIGDMIGDLALTYDWCNASLSDSQKTRWLAYADQAIWNVWHPADAAWGGKAMAWDGWATNDPLDNYYYSFLRATMLVGLAANGEDAMADQWLVQFRQTKVLDQLVPLFTGDLVGGGSREGTGYGVSMRSLWQLYDFWYATTGEPLASSTPQTRASMLSFIHQTLPTLDRVSPTGDQARESTGAFFDYHRQYLQELVGIYAGDSLAGPAQALLANCSIPAMTEQFMAIDDFLYDRPDIASTQLSGLDPTYYAPGIGELYTRSGWDTHATWVNLIAGPYTESHAHQDQGALMIYKDGWLVDDSVIQTHSGLRQETTAHSLVRVDSGGQPVPQLGSTTSQLVSLHVGNGWTYAAADLTPAYAGNPAITTMQREIVYLQPNVIVVYDRVITASGTSQVWQLATPQQPAIAGAVATIGGAHTMTVQRLAPSAASSSSFDYTSDPSGDYTSGFRLDETAAGGDQRYLHVIAIDGAVTSAVASGDSTTTVTLANGDTAVIAFVRDQIGAQLTYRGTTTTLAPGVDMLAE